MEEPESHRQMVTQPNQNSGKKSEDKKNDSFEVPEFLYRFSSTFFKRASAKDRENEKNKKNKIFELSGSKKTRELEKLNSRVKKTNKIIEASGHKRSASNFSQKSNVSVKSFKKVDVSLDNMSVKINELSDLNIEGGKSGHHHR